jgi:hypothetical protein
MGGSLGGSDTGLTVLARLVGKGELSEVPADHVELDFHIVEALSIVDGHVVADHFGHDDGVAEVSLDGDGLLSRLCVLLALLALGIQTDVFVLDLCMGHEVLRENLLLMRARKSSTTFS